MNEVEKERLIKKDIESIENKVRHAFNQGYEMGMKDREKLNCTDCIIEKSGDFIKSRLEIPNTCGDAISRQAVLDGLASIAKAKAKSDAQKSLMGRVMFFTEQLPSVSPQQKMGRWIYGEDNLGTGRDGWYCNQCGHFEFWDYSSNMKGAKLNLPNPCPNCGARMEVVK